MIDWTSSMQQTFEYYIVDPGTWKDVKKINTVISSTISLDSTAETLGSASISITESLGECYIRIYLIAIQNGFRYKYPLGTFLIQTPSTSFNGKISNVTMDAYTPLIELKEKQPPIGYYIPKEENIMDMAYRLVRENSRAPVVKPACSEKLFYDFVSDTNDTWMAFTKDLISNAKYEFSLDELGRILFSPKQNIASLQPVWSYNDDNSSILYPDISIDQDIYGIPNVIEVIYSNGSDYFYSKVVNDDPNSILSTINRGREIIYRVTDPDMIGDPSQNRIDEYAKNTLKNLSSVEYTITYTHAYCPVRIGDCVRLNYERAGVKNVKAKVISQNIKCEPGCPVEETAVFSKNLWG